MSAARTEVMSTKKKASRGVAVCVKNEGYEASLERHTIYVTIPDLEAEAEGQVRVIDEDGEDYLYPAGWFVALEVPKAVRSSRPPDQTVVQQGD